MTGHIIVVGNEKGGSGKSTTAMHLAVALLRAGHPVAVIDTDVRQGSLRRFLEHRRAYAATIRGHVPMPTYYEVDDGGDGTAALPQVLAEAGSRADAIIIDTPGSATPLSELAHSYADTLVTPLNDSFVDLDVLGRMNTADMTVAGPSQYSEMVWRQKIARARRDGTQLDWVVMRNRLSQLDSRNRKEMERALEALARRIGFRFVPGFGERVIFRELFLAGLTIMDIKETAETGGLSMSHVAARQEVRSLVAQLRLRLPTPATTQAAG